MKTELIRATRILGITNTIKRTIPTCEDSIHNVVILRVAVTCTP